MTNASEPTQDAEQADRGADTVEFETHLGERGLWIPAELRAFTAQIVFRTPRATIQHFQSGGGDLGPYYGLIDESHFGPSEQFGNPKNPGLAPDRVSIKPQGEETVILAVDVDPDVRCDGGATAMQEPDRPERKTKTRPNGDVVREAGDCRFVSSPARTVHERAEWPGDEYDYEYHPKCGQVLPPDSMWSWVEADDPEEAVMKYNLSPCSKCFSNAKTLGLWRMDVYSAYVIRSADTPARWTGGGDDG